MLNLAQLNRWPQRKSVLQQGTNLWHESVTNRQATLASDIFAGLSHSTKTKDPTYHSQVNWGCFVVSLLDFAYCFWANSCLIGQVSPKLLIPLPQSPEGQDYRYMRPHPAGRGSFEWGTTLLCWHTVLLVILAELQQTSPHTNGLLVLLWPLLTV